MAQKKQGGSTKNGGDSAGRRLGFKKFSDQSVKSGDIILRQRGTKFLAGRGVKMGKDHTLYSVEEGVVHFCRASSLNRKDKKMVNVVNRAS